MKTEGWDQTPIKAGFFSKSSIKELKHSVLIAEDGGFFLLMNSVDDNEVKMLMESGIDKEYLMKIMMSSHESGLKKKLIIEQGSSSKTRLGLSFGSNETSNILKLGEIVCCMKTSKFEGQINQIRSYLWEEYSLSLLRKLVDSPQLYDMLLVEGIDGVPKKHWKGYIIGQFLPVLDGNRAFMKPNSPFKKNWLHQRAYFLDIFAGVSKLLNLGICMTDVKPDNTLYNNNKLQGLLLLSGIIQKKNREDLEKDSFIKNIREITVKFAAPEIIKNLNSENSDTPVDLCKSLAFTLGKMLNETSFEENIETEIRPIIEKLMDEKPEKRITVEEGLELLKKISPPKLEKE